MKGLKKIALVTAIAAAPFAAQADLKAMDDSAMGDVTGQAGVTIDLSANVSVEEIAYEDQGFLVINGLKLGGNSSEVANGAVDALDDIRLTVDVAGTDATADLGNGGVFAGEYLGGQGNYTDADGNAVNIETDQAISDGDLVISLRSQTDGQAVDFGMAIGSVSLAKQEGNATNIGNLTASNPDSTVLVSDMQVDGYIGPVDVVVQEESNSMNINAYFTAGGEMTLPFMGTSLGFELHNRRGQSTVLTTDTDTDGNPISFAHAQVDISVAEDYFAADEDALAVNVQDFSGDLDLTNITMGNGESIGSIYMTDLRVTAETVIYGH
ncbi:DUF6160 family protein [Hydrocarboniclastica marina]|uniref:DUF6160 domain-containing protein n=1 Tax=Hydrocarboniclastica marina TaxID=2259620 RepID=A0A4V1D8S7_9ALTE|nr:DUF6160 family protein [Hydrocarboniclastica marina]MAL96832.1 hypothetical protein [Alteromonadaceae bacterium]QCF26230.1 hypothetical protein soil367_09965 [Hydrocarboniclastica marina]|tara:strand:+ start:4035 stop:5006 length:972 start_codon:yes stop_codon:yes gene_type:complete